MRLIQSGFFTSLLGSWFSANEPQPRWLSFSSSVLLPADLVYRFGLLHPLFCFCLSKQEALPYTELLLFCSCKVSLKPVFFCKTSPGCSKYNLQVLPYRVLPPLSPAHRAITETSKPVTSMNISKQNGGHSSFKTNPVVIANVSASGKQEQ